MIYLIILWILTGWILAANALRVSRNSGSSFTLNELGLSLLIPTLVGPFALFFIYGDTVVLKGKRKK